MTRSLDVIPVVHTEADLGGLAASLRAEMGERAWADKQQVVAQAWERITGWARAIDARHTMLYQDGLPAVDAAERIVRDLAANGSVNHRVLVTLIDHGAQLVGTECPDLLLREYELAKAGAAGLASGTPDAIESSDLLAQRDRWIAAQIDRTLPEDGRGVLFVGLLHEVERVLAEDIEVRHPLGRPRVVAGDELPKH
ncbi:MAG: hypothetical protein AAF235_00080 [Planctomycetota bacterium]